MSDKLPDTTIDRLVRNLDRNAPSDWAGIRRLREVDPARVTPYLIRTLLDRRTQPQRGVDEWGYDVESICMALLQLGRAYAAGCGPTLAHLLSLHVDPTLLDPECILDVFDMIGPSCAAYALPSLLDLISLNEAAGDALALARAQHARQLVETVTAQDRAPYYVAWDALMLGTQ